MYGKIFGSGYAVRISEFVFFSEGRLYCKRVYYFSRHRPTMVKNALETAYSVV